MTEEPDRSPQQPTVRNEFSGGTAESPLMQGRDFVVNIGQVPPTGRRPTMIPAMTHRIVGRPELTGQVIEQLCSEDLIDLIALTAVAGMGGIGKTTVAAECCRNPRVQQRFPDGVLWVTVGERADGAELAGKINDLASHLSGRHPLYTDPEQAGHHLGQLLAGKRCLLVIDDIWRASQLAPFLLGGGPGCRRLVTTRIRAALPPASEPVVVDAMSPPQAWDLLTDGLPTTAASELNALFARAGSWPVLLRLVNSALRRYIRGGSSVAAAAARIADRLTAYGPTGVDVTNADQRDAAVAATVEASLSLLEPARLQRYLELAVFPEDTAIPHRTLAAFWAHTGGLSSPETEQLCLDLVDLSLAEDYRLGPTPELRLHDVLHSYLHHRATPHSSGLHRALLDAHRGAAWWDLPEDEPYLWPQLSHHLQQAGLTNELNDTVCDPRWMLAVLQLHGPAVVEADLGRATGELAATLRQAITHNAHLLAPVGAGNGLGGTLLSRLDSYEPLYDWVKSAHSTLPRPLLATAWPLPDPHHPAFRRAFHHDRDSFQRVAISPDGTWLAGAIGDKVLLWNAEGVQIGLLTGHTRQVTGVAISPDGTWLITSSLDDLVRIWNTDGTPRGVLHGIGWANHLAISPDGTWLVAAGSRHASEAHLAHTVRLWGIDGTPRAVIDSGTDSLVVVAIAPCGTWFATASGNTLTSHSTAIQLWNADGTPRGTIDDTSSITCLAIGPDSTWLAAGTSHGAVHLWNTDGTPRGVLTGHSHAITDVAISPDGTWLASASDDKSLRLWSTDSFRYGQSTRRRNRVDHAALSPDGTWLATVRQDRTVRLLRADGVEIGVLICRSPSRWLHFVAISPDGTWLATAGDQGLVELWNADGTPRAVIEDESRWVNSLAISPCGRWLATTGHTGTVSLWNSDGSHRAELVGHDHHLSDLYSVAIAPDGTWLATAGKDGTVRLWNSDGGLRVTLEVHDSPIYSHRVTISPDGTWLASAGEDRTVRLWTADGTPRAVLTGHTDEVVGLAVSPDGSWLATSSLDKTVRLWDTTTLRCATFLRADSALGQLAWFPSSDRITVCSDLGLYVLDVLL